MSLCLSLGLTLSVSLSPSLSFSLCAGARVCMLGATLQAPRCWSRGSPTWRTSAVATTGCQSSSLAPQTTQHPWVSLCACVTVSMYVCLFASLSPSLCVRARVCVHAVFNFGSAKMLVKGEPNVAYICSRYSRSPELIFGARTTQHP